MQTGAILNQTQARLRKVSLIDTLCAQDRRKFWRHIVPVLLCYVTGSQLIVARNLSQLWPTMSRNVCGKGVGNWGGVGNWCRGLGTGAERSCQVNRSLPRARCSLWVVARSVFGLLAPLSPPFEPRKWLWCLHLREGLSTYCDAASQLTAFVHLFREEERISSNK